MNKVEAVGFVEPFVFEVFHNEFKIREHPARLNGTNIRPDHLGRGELSVGAVSC